MMVGDLYEAAQMSGSRAKHPMSSIKEPRTAFTALNPLRNFGAINELLQLLRLRRSLTLELARRDLSASHAGHSFGKSWIYIHPILIALVFFVIFGFVLGSKISLPKNFPGDYSSYILIGLIPWLMIQATLAKSTGALSGNANLVKQVVFPIEVLPVASTITATLPYVPAMLLVIIYGFAAKGDIPSTVVMLPLVFLMHAALSIGIAFILAGLTVFVRDIREFVNVFCLIAMYITPAVYVEEWVPQVFRPLLYLNPFSYLIWVYQDTLFYGAFNHPEAWAILFLMSVTALAGGYRLFRRLKPFYGNVL
jgi:lipopolysaccharide transport system permease protein